MATGDCIVESRWQAATLLGKVMFYRRTPWYLWFARQFRAIRRMIFGRTTPDWAKDTYKLLRYIDVFSLVPTLGAIATEPRHFFTRLLFIRNAKKCIYKTPLSFFSSTLTLAYLSIHSIPLWIIDFLLSKIAQYLLTESHLKIFALLILAVKHPQLTTYLAIGAPICSLPIWILCPSFALGLVALKSWPTRDLSLQALNPDLCLLPLDKKTYRQIRFASFFWAYLYFGIYGSTIAAMLLLIEILLLSAFISGSLGIFFVSMTAAVVYAVQFLLIRPYVEVLRSAMKMPTVRSIRANAFDISLCCAWLIKFPERLGKNDAASNFSLLISGSWQRLKGDMRQDIYRVRRSAADLAWIAEEYHQVLAEIKTQISLSRYGQFLTPSEWRTLETVRTEIENTIRTLESQKRELFRDGMVPSGERVNITDDDSDVCACKE